MTFSESDGRLQKCDALKGTGTHESLDRHFPLKWQYHEFCNPCFFPGSNPSGLFIHAWKYFCICPRCYWDRAESNISKFSNAFWSNLKRQVHQVFTFLCWGSRLWKYFFGDFDFFLSYWLVVVIGTFTTPWSQSKLLLWRLVAFKGIVSQ